jgi:hypothetical protein
LELILRAYAKNTTSLLGTLTHASDKKIRVHFNGPGEGSFTINRHDSQAAWCAPGNYVRAYLNSTANPVFGFFLEDGGDELVSPDEEGGEDLTRHGRGSAAVLEDAIIDATGSRATKEGTWLWTDSTMGAIAANLIDDAQAAGFLPMLTYDFSSGADTNGASWDVFDGQYELPVGLDLLEAIQRLQSAGFIVRVSHDFVMSAYKTIGTDSGTITFQAAVNISEAAEREIRGSAAKSRMLVQGTTRNGTLKFVWATDSAVETALGRPKAGFVNYAASASDTVLGRVGAQAIRRLKKRFDGLSSLGVLEDEFVPFTDYFPGDTVTIIVPGEYASLHVPVTAIGITEVDNGQAYVALEFEDVAFEPLQLKDRTDATQSPSSGGGGGGADTGTGCNDCPPVAGELIQCFFTPYSTDWFETEDINNTHSLTSTSLAFNSADGNGGGISVGDPVSSSNPYYSGLRQSLTLNLAFTVSRPDNTLGTHDLIAAGIGVTVQFAGGFSAQAWWEWDPDPADPQPPGFCTYLQSGSTVTSKNFATAFDGNGSLTITVSAAGCTASFDGHSISKPGLAIESAAGFIEPGVGFQWGFGTIPHSGSAGLLDIRNTSTEAWCTAGTPAPTSGQAVTNEPAPSGDGSTTTFSTQHPYMPGSLFVKVNGVTWTGDIATQDPTTGSFTFTHAPKAGADIVVDYRAA